ncbi:alpha-galactosidase, partial [Acinetobacter baumannii]
MGWSSWNNFRVGINEALIKKQADALVSSGMKQAGYSFINIDDGYFGGRDEKGNIKPHPVRFPGGMKKLADYIHAKGLKAGIYSDA